MDEFCSSDPRRNVYNKEQKVMRSALSVFGGSTLFTLVVFGATSALAASNSYSPASCVNTDANGTTHAIVDHNNGQLVNNNSSALIDICPVVSDSGGFAAQTANQGFVNGWSTGSASITAVACRTYAAGAGGICGSAANSTGVGVVHLTPPLVTGWIGGAATDGYYIALTLAPSTAIFSYGFNH